MSMDRLRERERTVTYKLTADAYAEIDMAMKGILRDLVDERLRHHGLIDEPSHGKFKFGDKAGYSGGFVIFLCMIRDGKSAKVLFQDHSTGPVPYADLTPWEEDDEILTDLERPDDHDFDRYISGDRR